MRAAALILVVAVVTGALLVPRQQAIFQAIPVAQQRIVYVSDDYSIFTTLSDGTDPDRITSGVISGVVLAQPLLQETAQFTWPTWSPGGDRLVASRFSGLERGQVSALALIEPPSSKEALLQISRRGPVDRVADGTFHFSLWSPDGQQLALIAPNNDASALLLSVGSTTSQSTPVTAGAPIYLTWSPDSTLMAIHHRESLLFRDSFGELFDTGRSSTSYRVPAISADSKTLAYVADTGSGDQLIARTIATGNERELLPVRTEAAFVFSPSNPEMLATTERPSQRAASYGALSLVDTTTGETQVLYDETVFGFWWSPDGKKIAVVGSGHDSFVWVVIDVETGEASSVLDFIPSPEFTTYIQFFDQFSLAQQLWSEDSNALTFAGKRVVDGEPADDDVAWVMDVTGEREPLAIGEASLAFFVPTGTR